MDILASICASVNDEVVHGIPSDKDKIIQDGDLVKIWMQADLQRISF